MGAVPGVSTIVLGNCGCPAVTWAWPAGAATVGAMTSPPHPTDTAAVSPELSALLTRVRDRRFAGGLRCPRCSSDRVQRWGTFSGRQRYRCTACRRTFSDLTGTPAAYIKKLPLWPAYLAHLRSGSSVRFSARHLRIHRATSFRWRHRLLSELRARERRPLHGLVEIDWFWIEACEKRPGTRRLDRGDGPGTLALIATDRRGGVASVAVPGSVRRLPAGWQLDAHLDTIVSPPLVLIGAKGRFGSVSMWARRRGLEYRPVRSKLDELPRSVVHLNTVRPCVARLRRWLVRFRGIGARYVPHYLAWHAALEVECRCRWEDRLLGWELVAER